MLHVLNCLYILVTDLLRRTTCLVHLSFFPLIISVYQSHLLRLLVAPTHQTPLSRLIVFAAALRSPMSGQSGNVAAMAEEDGGGGGGTKDGLVFFVRSGFRESFRWVLAPGSCSTTATPAATAR